VAGAPLAVAPAMWSVRSAPARASVSRVVRAARSAMAWCGVLSAVAPAKILCRHPSQNANGVIVSTSKYRISGLTHLMDREFMSRSVQITACFDGG
jgi:hypothetical protein